MIGPPSTRACGSSPRALHQTLPSLDGGERQATFARFLGDASATDLTAPRAALAELEAKEA